MKEFLADGKTARCQVTLNDGRQCSLPAIIPGGPGHVHHSDDKQPMPETPIEKLKRELTALLQSHRAELGAAVDEARALFESAFPALKDRLAALEAEAAKAINPGVIVELQNNVQSALKAVADLAQLIESKATAAAVVVSEVGREGGAQHDQ